MSKILITGITGFIGSHLASRLTSQKHAVVGVTKPSSSRDNSSLKPFLKDIKIHALDISDYYALSRVMKSEDPDIVVHLAAASSISDSFEKPFQNVETNMLGTMNVIHSIMDLPDYKKKRMLYASSAAIYGKQNAQPINEAATPNPQNPYSITKEVSEQYLRLISRVYGFNFIAMRPTNTYGRKLDRSYFVEYIVTSMLTNSDKIYLGAPDVIRDYIYVDDHVNAYIKAIEHPEVNNEAFNVGSGMGVSNKDLVFKIAEVIGFDETRIVLNQYPPNYPFRPYDGDQPKLLIDSSKLRKTLGWNPEIDLDEGIKKSITFWKQKLESS